MKTILEIAFSGFWQFCGITILLNGAAYFITNAVLRMWHRLIRMTMVLSRGWPPNHLDADGDWKEKQVITNENTLNQ